MPETTPPKSAWKTIIKVALFLVVAAFVFNAIAHRLAQVDWQQIRFVPGFLIGAALCMILAALASATAYRLLLASTGYHLPYSVVCAINWIAQTGKYIPGKAATVAGAVWLLAHRGVPTSLAGGIVLLRTGLLIVVGLIVAAPMTLNSAIRASLPLAWLWSALLAAVGLVCLHPGVFKRLANVTLRRLGRPPLEALPGFGHYFRPVLAMVAQWLFLGLALWLTVRSVTPIPLAQGAVFIPAAALGATFGFLAFFAPAGLGVREGILLLIIGPVVGGDLAAIIVVALRLLQTLVDITLALTGLVLLKKIDTPAPAKHL